MCLAMKGALTSANTNVRGSNPKTLKLTHISVEKLRHTSSFNPAIEKKKIPKRMVRIRQAISVRDRFAHDHLQIVTAEGGASEDGAEQRVDQRHLDLDEEIAL